MRFSTRTGVTDVPVNVEHSENGSNHDKALEAGEKAAEANVQQHGDESDTDAISSDAQDGVKNIEATTKVWSKSHLIFAYVMIWVIHFINTMQQGMAQNLNPYVTSAFQLHSLTAATGIMSSLIGGIFKLPLAKILDIWGRHQGFAIMLATLELGLIMMAGCNGVQTYAAAQVFYWVGFNGLNYTLDIFVADTSSLKNRSFMFAFASSPYIATVWITGPLAEAYLYGPGFRWGFGSFTLITLAVCLPLWFIFWWNQRKADKAGLTVKRLSRGSFFQTAKYYFWEFDVIGIFLSCAGLALFLLPFSLYSYQGDGWRSSLVICMIIFGGLTLVGFALYEKYYAPKTFIPFELLTDRTVLGACILAASLFVSFYIWDSYFSSFLQVVNGLSITQSNYIVNIYSIGSCFWALVVGLVIRWTGRFKALALYFGVPLTILGVGLMINFRQPDVNIGYIIMCQIFIAFAGGTLVICEQIAAMAVVDHQHIAVILALESMFASIGGAIGSTVAAAVWTGVFPVKLAEYLPPEAQANLTMIYGDILTQLSYPKGSETRQAIERAYGDGQKWMLTGGTAILVISIFSVVVWRDINVKGFKQVKGLVI